MIDFILPFIIFTLIVVIVIQAIERYFFAEQAQKVQDKLLEEVSRATKAVIAKNANEYVMTTSIDKVSPQPPTQTDPEFIDPDNLNDDQFDEALGIKRVAPK